MFFGDIPVDQAEGCLLAHSLRAGSRRLKKGHLLTHTDIKALKEAGVSEVVAARLAADDIHEDAAALRIAEACAGPGVILSAPFTGRVNLIAEAPGLAVLKPEILNQLNLIDEAVTIATLPSFDPVSARQMVATIKIIPFAVSSSVIEECKKIVGDQAPLVDVRPFEPLKARFIQTELPDTKASILDKTTRVLAERLSGIGGALLSEERVAHSVDVLSASLNDQTTDGAEDVILIAGASAITDRRDVIPAAIEMAGGTVEHFGMPVDPGNLLLLGHLGEKPVIGMPGCARSPKLNGFDWLLQRLSAGVPVRREDIMSMGVGGLLKEIETRPQPRSGEIQGAASHGPQRAPVIAGLLLAAGRSTRMGETNKLLEEINGKPMVRHTAETLLASKIGHLTVVLGHEASAVRDALNGLDVRFTVNNDYVEGLSTSLKTGLRTLTGEEHGFMVALGDMPATTTQDLDRLIAGFNPVEGRSICVATHKGKRGNPVLFASGFAEEMSGIRGDVGARQLIGMNEEVLCEIEIGEQALIDLDTKAALDAYRQK